MNWYLITSTWQHDFMLIWRGWFCREYNAQFLYLLIWLLSIFVNLIAASPIIKFSLFSLVGYYFRGRGLNNYYLNQVQIMQSSAIISKRYIQAGMETRRNLQCETCHLLCNEGNALACLVLMVLAKLHSLIWLVYNLPIALLTIFNLGFCVVNSFSGISLILSMQIY